MATKQLPRADAGIEPFQREFELGDALITLLIAVSHAVAERVQHLRGRTAATAFRRSLAARPNTSCGKTVVVK